MTDFFYIINKKYKFFVFAFRLSSLPPSPNPPAPACPLCKPWSPLTSQLLEIITSGSLSLTLCPSSSGSGQSEIYRDHVSTP